MQFDILVEETLARTISVEAESPQEAISKVEKMHYDGEISLDLSDWDENVEITEVEV